MGVAENGAAECCAACGRAIPDTPLDRLTDHMEGLLREIRDGDVKVADPPGHPYARMRTLGLIYTVSTHNGRRRRWRLAPAGLAIANASDRATTTVPDTGVAA